MKNIKDFETQAEQALNSLNNLQQVEANEFLHAKIMHRMQNTGEASPLYYNKLMVRLAAVLCLFICINAVSFFVLNQSKTTVTKKPADITVFAQEYGLTTNLNSY